MQPSSSYPPPPSANGYPPPGPPPSASSDSLELSSLPLTTGTVRWFNAEKGWGFVAPNAGQPGHGTDSFVHQNQLQSDGFRTLEPNQVIEYRLRVSDKGKHIAMAVTAPGGGKLPGPARDAMMARGRADRGDRDRDRDFHPPPPHDMGAPPYYPPYPPAPSLLPSPPFDHPAGPPYDHRNARPPGAPYFVGVVKSFDLQRGYGFVVASSSPSNLPLPHGDVFVHQSAVHMEGRRELGPGLPVEFCLGHDDKNRKAIAVQVTGPGGRLLTREEVDDAIRRGGSVTYVGPPGPLGPPGRGPGDRMGGGREERGPAVYPPPPRVGDRDVEFNSRIQAKDGRVYRGEVLSFDLSKKFGFIKQEDGKENLFLHASRVDVAPEDIVKGLQVEYQIVSQPAHIRSLYACTRRPLSSLCALCAAV